MQTSWVASQAKGFADATGDEQPHAGIALSAGCRANRSRTLAVLVNHPEPRGSRSMGRGFQPSLHVLPGPSCGSDPCAGQFPDWFPLPSELMNHEFLLQSGHPQDRPGREFLNWHNSEVYLG